jgi:microsomal dipeptidase-like Zn-dependent dipeptidase
VVQRLEEKGILIDLAHASTQVVQEVLTMATRPVVVSHTGVAAVCPGPRNLTDEQLKAIAANGGLIGIGYWDGAVCDTTPAGVVKSLRYAIDLIGADHVALGSDYDGTTTVRFDASESVALIDAMLTANFTEEEIRKVAGENTLRFLATALQ